MSARAVRHGADRNKNPNFSETSPPLTLGSEREMAGPEYSGPAILVATSDWRRDPLGSLRGFGLAPAEMPEAAVDPQLGQLLLRAIL